MQCFVDKDSHSPVAAYMADLTENKALTMGQQLDNILAKLEHESASV